MNPDSSPKQEVAERLRASNSVLVSVSNNPSVDQLASALGLSLMLTKLGKHATAVFSGKIPNTMQFLEPDKTFETSVDGLRDFIISLDKDKADKLRYKVEDDVVKIYITPYKSKISKEDLRFDQGDFNVDLVIALGAHKRNELDKAIVSHGRILHDAAIVTINNQPGTDGSMGSIDWTDTGASSLAEMLLSMSESLEAGLIDSQISTAFLTGIVAATERFKNELTTPKVMTMAAQLMAAGANQQLIATNLQVGGNLGGGGKIQQKPAKEQPKSDDYSGKDLTIDVGEHSDQPAPKKKKSRKKKKKVSDDSLLEDIEGAVLATHNKLGKDGRTVKPDLEDPAIRKLENELAMDPQANLLEIEEQVKTFDAAHEDEQKDEDKGPIGDARPSDTSAIGPDSKPLLGGTFNATSQEARDALEADRASEVNRELLKHGDGGGNEGPRDTLTKGKDLQPLSQPAPAAPPQDQPQQMAPSPVAAAVPDNIAPADVDVPSKDDLMQDLAAARKAVEDAMNEAEFQPAGHPVNALNASPMAMEDGSSGDLNLNTNPPVANTEPTQPAPAAPVAPAPAAPPPPPPAPAPAPAPQAPAAPPVEPRQPEGPVTQMPPNPLYNVPVPPQQPSSPPPPPAFGPGQMPVPPPVNPPAPGVAPADPNGANGVPPMPPSAPPPMPPAN